jgi:hypothetical protein
MDDIAKKESAVKSKGKQKVVSKPAESNKCKTDEGDADDDGEEEEANMTEEENDTKRKHAKTLSRKLFPIVYPWC